MNLYSSAYHPPIYLYFLTAGVRRADASVSARIELYPADNSPFRETIPATRPRYAEIQINILDTRRLPRLPFASRRGRVSGARAGIRDRADALSASQLQMRASYSRAEISVIPASAREGE